MFHVLFFQQNLLLKVRELGQEDFCFFSFLFWMKHGGHLMWHVHVNIRIHVYTYMGIRLLHGKRWRTKEHKKVPTEGVDGEGLTGGHQGYMDFLFWGILCCKFFSFFSFFCTLRNTKTERLSKREREKEREMVSRSQTQLKSKLPAFLSFDIWEGNSPSLSDFEDQ